MGNLKIHNQTKQISTHAEPKKVQKRGRVGSNFETLKEIRQFYSHESEGSSGFEMRRGQEAEESKRRDGEMMRAHLHKLRIDSNFRKIYHEKEKKYRVWKARLASKRNITLPSSLLE